VSWLLWLHKRVVPISGFETFFFGRALLALRDIGARGGGGATILVLSFLVWQ